MALFDKLFSLKRRLDSDNYDPKDRGRSCQINPEQVRLLLFKECDWRGRRLLFDSSAIQKVPAGKHDKPNGRQDEAPCIVEVSDGFSFVYKGSEADANVLGEMIFGAVAMNYKNVSLKIHIMDEPRRLMCTKVFCVPTSRRISRVERKASDRTEASSNSMRNTSHILKTASKPLNVPSLSEDGVALSFSMDRGDSGFCGDQSPYSSVDSTYDYFSMFDAWDGSASQEDFYSFHSLPGRKLSTSSNGSWQRRTFQNMATRFDLGQSSHLLNVPPATTSSDSQIYCNSSTSGTSGDSIASGSSIPQRKSKLGLAILITVTDSAQLDLVRKCVEHSPQLQALVCRLRLATMLAGASGGFVSTLHRAAGDAARWLSDLIYGPRLQPTWLNMMTSDAKVSNKLADSLLSDLCSVLAVGDTKTTNFFISTLLTHVLTYHLGWVTTVSPYDTNDHQKVHPSNTKRPYNVLWAQLSDLCGSIGFPPRAARTIISGEKNTQFVNRLLSILAYFLRCGDVKRTEFQYRECALNEIKTISVNKVESVGLKRTATRVNKLGDSDDSLTVPLSNTQKSDSSVSTLVASDVSLKKTSTFADLRQKLSSSAECSGSSTGQKPTCPLRRNPTTMLSSLKASSDSSLNSTVSDDSVPEQKVLFVLGDDEKLVGLKNKSTNGKCVKKSSKVQNEPVVLEPQEKTECERKGCVVRSTESPSKCCGQTLQHSKPIKHSGFKFEFDKYPQIVTNYMKSKNLEILDRHYIGKPGNLKLDNYQFDPMIVPPIQEEKCDACVKCQMMESMLQTPTNASEMEYMNDMPRISEPQYAKETVVADNDKNHREVSPKTFVRRRKENVLVVNLIKNIKAANEANNVAVNESNNALSESKLERTINETDNSCVVDNEPLDIVGFSVAPIETTPKISIQAIPLDSTENTQNTIDTVECPPLQRSNKLKFTKSSNNLKSLLSLEDSCCGDSSNELQFNNRSDLNTATSTNETIISSSKLEPAVVSQPLCLEESKYLVNKSQDFNRANSSKDLELTVSSNESSTLLTSTNDTKSTFNDLKSTLSTSANEMKATSSNELKSTSSNELKSTSTNEFELTSVNELKSTSLNELRSTSSNDHKSTSSNDHKSTSSNELMSMSSNEVIPTTPPLLKPLELRRSELRRMNRERERARVIEVKRVTEFPLPELCETASIAQRSGFDASLLGGVSDHYVPDLILQGTIAKPCAWEPELRRDLDITSYLNKQLDTTPIQAVAIIGDTNTWEVRVVGRDCGTGGMSSLVGAMLDALPAMWKAKVPAHQCLSFLESKLREFCVLSKTLADMLMSTDFCDIATLTKSLNIDVNDVPLLLAVATTHTPQVATRYGISYR